MALTQIPGNMLSGSNTSTTTIQSNGTTAITIDSSQNVGIGKVPNAWGGHTALQMTGPSLWGLGGLTHLTTNTYFDGTNYKYIATDYASDYYQNQGAHVWRYAASGTAGANVTFVEAMRIDASGNLLPGANGTQNFGSASLRWANLYTSDLHLSNGIGNYTIVEGEEDLFLYNNKNGKTYKFALIEVDPNTAPAKMKE